jgi:hypothetical protein
MLFSVDLINEIGYTCHVSLLIVVHGKMASISTVKKGSILNL